MSTFSDYQNLTDVEKLAFLTKTINLSMERLCNSYWAGFNLTTTQSDILRFIYSAEKRGIECNQVDIEREFRLSNPTITGILKRLEDKGFIMKQESLKDRRYKWVRTTQKAKDVFPQTGSAEQEFERIFRGELGEASLHQAVSTLEIILDNLKDREDNSLNVGSIL